MDPTACWKELGASLRSGNWSEAYCLAQALQAWIDKGGFAPMVVLSPSGRVVDKSLARETCRHVVELARVFSLGVDE
jgi:hypothetical protein